MVSNKHYRRFSQISSIFVAVYAVLGFPLGIYFETDIFDGIEAYLGIFLFIAGILAPCIALSFPFFRAYSTEHFAHQAYCVYT